MCQNQKNRKEILSDTEWKVQEVVSFPHFVKFLSPSAAFLPCKPCQYIQTDCLLLQNIPLPAIPPLSPAVTNEPALFQKSSDIPFHYYNFCQYVHVVPLTGKSVFQSPGFFSSHTEPQVLPRLLLSAIYTDFLLLLFSRSSPGLPLPSVSER